MGLPRNSVDANLFCTLKDLLKNWIRWSQMYFYSVRSRLPHLGFCRWECAQNKIDYKREFQIFVPIFFSNFVEITLFLLLKSWYLKAPFYFECSGILVFDDGVLHFFRNSKICLVAAVKKLVSLPHRLWKITCRNITGKSWKTAMIWKPVRVWSLQRCRGKSKPSWV